MRAAFFSDLSSPIQAVKIHPSPTTLSHNLFFDLEFFFVISFNLIFFMVTNHAHLTRLERFTVRITEWMGTPASIIVHTFAFAGIFGLYFLGYNFDQIMLILTTAVSLEAIYLALFIQMTVNRNTESLEDVEEDVEGLESNLKKINASVSNLELDIDEIQEDVDEIQSDIDEIQEDVDEISEEDTVQNKRLIYVQKTHTTIKQVEEKISDLNRNLQDLQKNISHLQTNIKQPSKPTR